MPGPDGSKEALLLTLIAPVTVPPECVALPLWMLRLPLTVTVPAVCVQAVPFCHML